MNREPRLEELFQGEGALPRPSPTELASLGEVLRRMRGAPVPLASADLAERAAQEVREELLVEGLLRGEGALSTRVDSEELDSFCATIQWARSLEAPKASPRVAEGVRRRLTGFRLQRRRQGPPTSKVRALGWFAAMGRAVFESPVIRSLAAVLVLQALTLPVLAEVVQRHIHRETERVRSRFRSLEYSSEMSLAVEPIRLEEMTASADPDPEPIRPLEPREPESFAVLGAEDDLLARWRAFLERQQPEVRLQRLQRRGSPLGIHRFIEDQAALLAREVASLEKPLELSLALRALILAGNSERVGDHSRVVREALPRLLDAWEEASFLERVASAATFAELYLCTRGSHLAAAQQSASWLIDWVQDTPNLQKVPTWVLAEAAQVLEWAPILVSRMACRERAHLEAELHRRALRGGKAGEGAAAAALRAFPLSSARNEYVRLTFSLRMRPAESATEEPWPLVHLAWGLFPPSDLWADFNAALRGAALAAAPRSPMERALWLLALTVFYAAPEEMRAR